PTTQEPSTPEPSTPEPTTPAPTTPEPTTPEPTTPEPTTPEPTTPEPTTQEPSKPEPSTPEPTTPAPTTPEPTTPEPTTPEPTTPEPTTPELTTPHITTPEPTKPEPTTPSISTPEPTTPEPTTPPLTRVQLLNETKLVLQDILTQYKDLSKYLETLAPLRLSVKSHPKMVIRPTNLIIKSLDKECISMECKSLNNTMQDIAGTSDGASDWTPEQNSLGQLELDQKTLETDIKNIEDMGSDFTEAGMVQEELQMHQSELVIAINDVITKISDLTSPDNDSTVLFIVLGTVGVLLVLGLAAGAIYVCVVRKKKNNNNTRSPSAGQEGPASSLPLEQLDNVDRGHSRKPEQKSSRSVGMKGETSSRPYTESENNQHHGKTDTPERQNHQSQSTSKRLIKPEQLEDVLNSPREIESSKKPKYTTEKTNSAHEQDKYDNVNIQKNLEQTSQQSSSISSSDSKDSSNDRKIEEPDISYTNVLDSLGKEKENIPDNHLRKRIANKNDTDSKHSSSDIQECVQSAKEELIKKESINETSQQPFEIKRDDKNNPPSEPEPDYECEEVPVKLRPKSADNNVVRNSPENPYKSMYISSKLSLGDSNKQIPRISPKKFTRESFIPENKKERPIVPLKPRIQSAPPNSLPFNDSSRPKSDQYAPLKSSLKDLTQNKPSSSYSNVMKEMQSKDNHNSIVKKDEKIENKGPDIDVLITIL
ncbi:unnamed protein product, partial [Meganyctiphanes norvegica]